ncbi:hypothetical protein [Endozoicomonas sp. ALC066]|uniref:hypothetical protein n=1 Tax=Endozoicomonas sp. ALC066 TaxID=3403078 RepID=UPI003BB71942
MKILLTLVFSIPLVTNASPSPIVHYLMNEPLTLWDMGIYKMNSDFRIIKDYDGSYITSTSIGYNWEKNNIVIAVSDDNKKNGSKSESDFKEWCVKAVHAVKQHLGISPKNGKPIYSDHSLIHTYFRHKGYVNNNEPESLGSHLDSITMITGLYLPKKESSQKMLRCNATLLGTEIIYTTH